MSTIQFIDSAYPPPSLEGSEGLVFYAGGDTPHVWSLAEVERYPARYRLPVWVCSVPDAHNASGQAAIFTERLMHVYNAPVGTLVAVDTETAVDPSWMKEFVSYLNHLGYPVIDYGSQSRVFGNDNPDGYYWGADWTGTPHIYPGDSATQYVSFQQYDLSDFKPNLPLWDTSIKDDNMISGQITDRAFVPFPANSMSRVQFYRDFLGGKSHAVIRVAVHTGAGYHIEEVTLSEPVPVTVSLAGADAVSVVVLPGSDVPVGFTVS